MPVVVKLTQVQQHYGALQVLHHINWTLHAGETIGLFGHNGAGKTTTVRLILGLIQHTSGEVMVLGSAPTDINVRRQIGFLPENVMFYPQLTGYETLAYFARLKKVPLSQVDALLAKVGLGAVGQQQVKSYSKGMRQRLGIAQALLGKPKLLVLDEPTVGLDPIATQSLYQLMEQLKREGTSIIICSHVLPGVEAYIDKAVIMARGHIEALGTLAELRKEARLPTKIRTAGLNGLALQHQGILKRYELADGEEEFLVAPNNTTEVASQLITLNPSEIAVSPPSLEDLYCHFTQRAGAMGAAGVQQ